jgi:ubiquinone/menaquinone biosynthesis C-methylase UbiE
MTNGRDADPETIDSAFTTSAWRDQKSADWLSRADRLEATIEPVDDPLLRLADPRPGESVVDIGCGRGVTTRKIAELLGPDGRVIGIDVGDAVIAAASTIAPPAGAASTRWVAGDAAEVVLDEPVDLVTSRFGVMFFDEPEAAFANLHRMAKPSGRLAVAVWCPRTDSEFQSRALEAAVAVARDLGVELALSDPLAGPFRYGDTEWFAAVLERAGWRQVEARRVDLDLYLGGPGVSAAESAELGMSNGPLAVLTSGLPDDVRAAIQLGVERDLASAWDGVGIRLNAAISLVSARSSPGL